MKDNQRSHKQEQQTPEWPEIKVVRRRSLLHILHQMHMRILLAVDPLPSRLLLHRLQLIPPAKTTNSRIKGWLGFTRNLNLRKQILLFKVLHIILDQTSRRVASDQIPWALVTCDFWHSSHVINIILYLVNIPHRLGYLVHPVGWLNFVNHCNNTGHRTINSIHKNSKNHRKNTFNTIVITD